MEKNVMTLGFVLMVFFFFVACFTTNAILWGCVPSAIIMLFGWFFWDE